MNLFRYLIFILYLFLNNPLFSSVNNNVLNLNNEMWQINPIDNINNKIPAYSKNWIKIKGIPHNWNKNENKKIKQLSIIWYRCDFNLHKNYKSKVNLIKLTGVDDSDVTWLNGKKIGTTGLINNNADVPKHISFGRPRFYVLSTGLLKFNQINTLIIRIQSSHERFRGFPNINSKVELGPIKKIIANYLKNSFLDLLPPIIIITVSLYFLILFLRFPGKVENLFFFLFCLSVCTHFLVISPAAFIFTDNFFVLRRTQLFLINLAPYFFMYFIYFFFKRKLINKYINYLIVLINIIPIVIIVPIFSESEYLLRNVGENIQRYFLLPFILSLYIIIINARKKDVEAYYLLLALLLLIFSTINDILVFQQILPWGIIGQYGTLILILLLSIILARRFVDLHKLVEEKNLELTKLDKIKDEFLHNISRDINTPIEKIIKTSSKLATIKLNTNEKNSSVNEIYNNSVTLEKIVKKLLTKTKS